MRYDYLYILIKLNQLYILIMRYDYLYILIKLNQLYILIR